MFLAGQDKMHVIGTAGHVDHGKSTLITALTGINPDRLKEEREREMTIDLGFAWMALPDGTEVGIVDVPGHRDFIENMLAGVAGIDAVIFVVAADEGIMPQTREHLAILDLLEVQSGLIALTKVDLVDDPDWLGLVEDDIRAICAGTVLAEAPLVKVSAYTGLGLDDLKITLSHILADKLPRINLGKPRLPVDRVFSISGFGTIVTGTLIDGELHGGDDVTILPANLNSRIRGLQTHKQKEDLAVPGSRTAINLTGVRTDEINRGDVVVLSASHYDPTRLVDVRFRALADLSRSITHNSDIRLYTGTSDVQARLRLLGTEELRPGERAWLQLDLKSSIVAEKGDHFILRRPSPGETLGGGIIIDAHPKHRHKRFDPDVLAGLEMLSSESPLKVFFKALLDVGPAPLSEITARSRLDAEIANRVISELNGRDQIFALKSGNLDANGSTTVIATPSWEKMTAQMTAEVMSYHKAYPLRRGIPREQLKSRLRLSSSIFVMALDRWLQRDAILEMDGLMSLPGRVITLNPRQQEAVEALLKRFDAAPYSPPTIKECQAELGEELYRALVESGKLMPVSSEIVFKKENYEKMREDVHHLLKDEGILTVAEFRDRYHTSRRYALAFLEHLDAKGVTIRQGDNRVLGKE